MVFSDTSTKLGLIQDCEQLLFGNYGEISGNANRLYDFTARLNRSLDKAVSKILSCDGRWQFDDANYTDLPIGSTNIVASQADYTMAVSHLDVLKVLAKDSAGNLRVLTPIDESDPIGIRYLNETTTAETGIPQYYDKKGSSIILYPTPNYASTAGLVVHFQRGPSYFAYTDTTKAPGFPSTFHRFVSLDTAVDYGVSKTLPQVDGWARERDTVGQQMEDFFSKRSRDEQKSIRPVIRSSR